MVLPEEMHTGTLAARVVAARVDCDDPHVESRSGSWCASPGFESTLEFNR